MDEVNQMINTTKIYSSSILVSELIFLDETQQTNKQTNKQTKKKQQQQK